MKSLLGIVTLITFVGVVLIVPIRTEAIGALTVCIIASIPVAVLLFRNKTEREFLLQLFVAAVLIRIIVGTAINVFDLQGFFAGDASTYDFLGSATVKAWEGDRYYAGFVNSSVAWGFVYLIAAVYKVIGRNMLAIQYVNSVIGAATAPVIFFIAHTLFGNRSVARKSAYFVAFFPSLVLWTSQVLKDGQIVFLISVAILLTLRLGEKLTIKNVVFLALSLAALISFRFYIFYMVTASVFAAFIIGMREFSAITFLRQLAVLVLISLFFTYLGLNDVATRQLGYFGDLRIVELSRADQSTAQSGFGQSADVSTPEGAVRAVPLGVVYLLFAPFPWELRNLRQSITLPEMLVWWACFPPLILGLWFTIRYRLRQAFVILIFTTMLTLAYSIFQGNVGTAYRQRSQLLVFYFIFVSVGITLIREKREERLKHYDRQQKSIAVIPVPTAANQAIREA